MHALSHFVPFSNRREKMKKGQKDPPPKHKYNEKNEDDRVILSEAARESHSDSI